MAEGPDTVAAFIGEPVQGAGGVIPPPADYWPRVRDICSKYDVLLIADEVITGFGRTGRWFALEHWGVEADMVSFAKGITSGYMPPRWRHHLRPHPASALRATGHDQVHARLHLLRSRHLLRRRPRQPGHSSKGKG